MSVYRYSAAALNGDLCRAGIGIALCGGPIVFADIGLWASLILAVPAFLFAAFGGRTWLRRTITIAADDGGLTAAGLTRTRVDWRDLSQFKLSYFSTRRDRSNGWMQLNLRGPGGRLSIDSNLDGFDEICRRAFRAAHDNGLELSEATLRNLTALGLVGESPADARPEGSTGWGNPADWRR